MDASCRKANRWVLQLQPSCELSWCCPCHWGWQGERVVGVMKREQGMGRMCEGVD